MALPASVPTHRAGVPVAGASARAPSAAPHHHVDDHHDLAPDLDVDIEHHVHVVDHDVHDRASDDVHHVEHDVHHVDDIVHHVDDIVHHVDDIEHHVHDLDRATDPPHDVTGRAIVSTDSLGCCALWRTTLQ